ncbi:MAG: hypothetical protein ACOYO7_03435 [Phycisphaerales bacterium]|jgi:hypothetical protein
MNRADAFGLLSQGVIVAAAVRTTVLVGRRNGPREGRAPRPWVFALVVAAVVAVPFAGTTAARELRALWGDPSATSALLLAMLAAWPSALPALPRTGSLLAFACLAGAALLGPTFVGWPTGIDIHGWGFTAWPVLLATAPWCALAWHLRADAWVAVVGSALVLWGTGCVPSDNAWDALVDPGLVAWAAAMGIARPAGSAARRRAAVRSLRAAT